MAGYLFGGNTGVSYSDLQRRREIADALSKQIMGDTPKTTAQGIGALMKGIGAGMGRYSANKGLKEGTDGVNSAYESILGRIMGGSPSTAPSVASSGGNGGSIPMPGAAAEIAATSPATGDTFAPFMDTIKAGGVNNPYALAAIAATGRAESGWSAANANRTWSDPSESGQPGRAGGIMSWRGPRYQALAATGDLSPQGQAKFFLNEDPGLIQKLNNARSLEEAQQLMNNAWAFAGYNRPGGESARRMGFAKGYLSGFQGGGTEVASLDPSAGMSAFQAIEAAAPRTPNPGGYRDPMVSAPNSAPAQQPPQAGNLPMPAQPQTPVQQPAPMQVAQNGQFPAAPQPPAPPQAPANPYQGVDPEMLKLLSNPFLDADKKQIIQGIIQQQMQRNDPGYQLDMETKRAQLDALRAKPQKTWQKLDDTTLFNPETGETQRVGDAPVSGGQFRFEGKSVEAQALNGLMESGQLTPAEAQQLAAGKQITDPSTGSLIFMTPQGVFGRSPDGLVAPVSAPQPPSPPQAPVTPVEWVDIFGGPLQSPAVPTPPAPPQAPQRQGMIPLTPGDGLDAKARQRQQMASEYGLDPNSEEGKRFILTGTLPASDKGVTAGDRQAIREADDVVMQGEATTNLLKQAMELSPQANQGFLSGTRAWLGANLPDNAFPDFISSPESGKATIEYDNIIKDQALGQLKAIFGAAPTEGERAILLEIQGSSNQPREVRENILKRAQAAVQRRIDFNSARAADLRSGNYYKTGRTAPATPAAPNVDDLLKKYGG
ncbi:hypothetical protein [Agrobacterium sp. OT33]|uniref:hypothetical protein n=1 Tax=Agrobacterium sp. OT33 TaxID=2815338 RepID=UPI001A8E1219|nr:hypothetical protein [Agrobacterium sp. OT33]MBO0125128.1 hypothetical protein [Agrobacterium sp. OT33]